MTLAARLSRRLRDLVPKPPRIKPGPTILLYHRIAEEQFDPWSLAVSSRHFAGQMEWLALNRTVLPLAEFARLHREQSLPRDAAAITFDDGYACNAHVAAPILQRVGLPATIFLPAEIIEQGRRFWWDELQAIVMDGQEDALTLDGETIELGPRQEEDARWAPNAPPGTRRQHAFMALWSRLRTRSSGELTRALAEFGGGRDNGREETLRRPMTLEEVRSVPAEIEFGSHALTHRSLPALNSSDKAREILDSAGRCGAVTGYRPRTFAYPFGDADAECIRLVAEAGFECACITGEQSVTPRSHVYALPRAAVGNVGAEGLAQLLGQG